MRGLPFFLVSYNECFIWKVKHAHRLVWLVLAQHVAIQKINTFTLIQAGLTVFAKKTTVKI